MMGICNFLVTLVQFAERNGFKIRATQSPCVKCILSKARSQGSFRGAMAEEKYAFFSRLWTSQWQLVDHCGKQMGLWTEGTVVQWGRSTGQNGDEQIVAEIMGRCFCPSLITTRPWEGFHFVGQEIKITEATDSYGAVVWPSALVLCHFLEMNVKLYNWTDKNVIEIGAGTGLVSIVASFLGARVIATDLPDLLGNLQYNLVRNTKMRCKHEPQVKELFWGVNLEKNFPRSLCQFDYILAADVVYHHPYLDELLLTFDHLCKDNTTIIWAMRFRLEKENQFVDKFQKLFKLEVISDFPSLSITLFKAKRRCRVRGTPTAAS